MDLHDDLAAALADRYQVERELGRGGMAVVYLARDVKHSRHVAVKVLRPDLASSIGAERFLREIQLAAGLTHPNILTLHDSGSAEGGALLYYVMPYVEGETLRARLDREHQLPVDEALAITRQVAAALDYAHGRGVVHRDVKPENILLTGEHACVADFGLARALYAASTRRLTESAVAVGTPAYMSPEQAAADPDVDGRADVYSLGCVVFEMLAGTAPYRGATAQAVLAQHLTAPVPSICGQRPHCPQAVDAAVQRAMEKIPADRFRTAGEMVKAMAPAAAAAVAPARRRLPRAVIFGVPAGLAVLVAAAALALGRGRGGAAPRLDEATYAVAPFVTRDGGRDTSMLAERVADAVREWRGVRVVDIGRATPATATVSASDAVVRDPVAAAAAAGAGRAVMGMTVAARDSVELRLSLYDVAEGREIDSRRITVPVAGAPWRAQLRGVVNSLLRTRGELPWRDDADETRPSLTAWRAYDQARDQLTRWDVGRAVYTLRAAVREDPDDAQAQLWLALAQQWALEPVNAWRGAARRATELSAHLTPRDSLIAAAQLALADGHYPEACDAYRRILPLDSTGVIGWFGLGECQRWDGAVLRDPASPSGYRFRSSFEGAARAYMHIVTDRAPPQPAFAYARLAEVLYTQGNQMRRGRAADQPGVMFFAYPALEAESLAFVPRPYAEFVRIGPEALGRRKDQAIVRNRARLRDLYVAWAESAPSSVDAHLALATLLEATEQLTSGEGQELSALREIRRARALATTLEQRRQLDRFETRLLVKSGRWGDVAAFVDSLFAAAPHPVEDTAAAYLGPAALTGRIRAAAEIFRVRGGSLSYPLALPDGQTLDLPPAVAQDAADAFAYAIVGACVDRLRGFPARADAQLRSYLPGDSSRSATLRAALFRWPLRLAVPCLGPAPLLGIDPGNDDVVVMEQALARHDTAAVRARYRQVMTGRAHDRPGDVSMDATYLESWLLVAIGDTAEATSHLDRSLEALPTLGTWLLTRPSESAALVRAMGLRAELAAAARDAATAARWGDAVSTLWAHADPELQPYVGRMRALARAGPAPVVGSGS